MGGGADVGPGLWSDQFRVEPRSKVKLTIRCQFSAIYYSGLLSCCISHHFLYCFLKKKSASFFPSQFFRSSLSTCSLQSEKDEINISQQTTRIEDGQKEHSSQCHGSLKLDQTKY